MLGSVTLSKIFFNPEGYFFNSFIDASPPKLVFSYNLSFRNYEKINIRGGSYFTEGVEIKKTQL